jgi:arginine decarboxylase-like protein
MANTSFESKVQKAVETWTETNREAYQALAKGVIAASEQNAQLAQSVYESGIVALRAQAETTRVALEAVASASEKQWQAVSALAQDSANAYSEFFTAPYAYYQKWVETLTQAARR